MRYIDTGSRDPKHALGTWLSEVLFHDTPVAALRVQTGFFGAGVLGYFKSRLRALRDSDGHTRFLVGSNDGETPRSAVEDLLTSVGDPRPGLKVGVVSFQNGLFHPKVFHIVRSDGSSAAYVGSANLTAAGVGAQHIEAGIILDTKEADSHEVLGSIAEAVDEWFDDSRAGLYTVQSTADLDALVHARIIDVTSPPRIGRTMQSASGGAQSATPAASLFPLVALPSVHETEPATPPASPEISPGGMSTPGTPGTSITTAGTGTRAPASIAVERWSKRLPPSDAQRKQGGNQSGVIALTQGDYKGQIDQTTYFRHDLFGNEHWAPARTMTGLPMEVALVCFQITIDGTDHGSDEFKLSHAVNREHNQNNYTTTLHLDPITRLFSQSNMTGKTVEIERYVDGTYSLTIAR